MFDPARFIHDRVRGIDASGIRRVFDLAAKLKDPVNLSIGQPEFDVPQPIKDAAIHAIEDGFNRYTPTQGTAELRAEVVDHLVQQFPDWKGSLDEGGESSVLITSGVSGALVLAILSTVGPGDEVLIPDPYFVMYKHLVNLAGATPVYVDTYPDFQVTAERLARHLTPRTKLLLLNTPANPTGTVIPLEECGRIVKLCDEHGVLLISDEIYDEFCYEKVSLRPGDPETLPSPALFSDRVLLMRGFSKTWAMTGWRLGYVAGPRAIVDQMTKLQQYSFVCAPSMVQAAGVVALRTDVSDHVAAYAARRDRVIRRLSERYELAAPGGAFYAFPRVPEKLGLTGSQFVERAVERGLLIIPGGVFSQRDTHFRLSYACADAMLDRGLDMLLELAK